MTKKKTAAVVAVAFGLTATATGSYATTGTTADAGSNETAASTAAQSSAVKIDRLKTNVAKSTDDQSQRRRCVGKRKIRNLKLFMTYKRAMRRLPRATYKNRSGGLLFRSFNACTSSISNDLDLVFKKKGRKKNRKWRLYNVSVYWR